MDCEELREALSAPKQGTGYRTGHRRPIYGPMVCRLRTILAVALWCVIAMALPAAANATTASGSVTMISESGDYIAQGHDFLFDAPNSLTISGGPTHFVVTTPTPSGAAFGYTLNFYPPSGSQLQVGNYDDAGRFGSGTNGGLDVW